ncbi:MAG: hypothetical protein EOP53_09860, partial [Sphingobacteriales bacterium]
MLRIIIACSIVVNFLSACSSSKNVPTTKNREGISRLKLLDEYVIPFNKKFDSTIIGGLSGIDYDKVNDRYFIISDERSYTTPARFYVAAINIKNKKIKNVNFQSVHTLKQPGGSVFPSFGENAQRTPDPESIRYNPLTNRLTWTSEGDREVRRGKMIYQNPYAYEMDLQGNFKDSFFIPANLHMYPTEKGSRENGVLEGSSFNNNYEYYYTSMEHPIYEDGPVPSLTYSGAPVRFTKFDAKTKQPLAQYAYQLDAIAKKPVPANKFAVNGVSEILFVGNNRFLVLERSFSTGIFKNTIKIYLADFTDATDVSDITGLHLNKTHRPAIKKLLLNMDDIDRYVDNVEGIERFRISSIEPNLLTDEVIAFVAQSKRFVPHFHIPLQSGS